MKPKIKKVKYIPPALTASIYRGKKKIANIINIKDLIITEQYHRIRYNEPTPEEIICTNKEWKISGQTKKLTEVIKLFNDFDIIEIRIFTPKGICKGFALCVKSNLLTQTVIFIGTGKLYGNKKAMNYLKKYYTYKRYDR